MQGSTHSRKIPIVLLAYIDEVGDFGAYRSPDDPKYRGFPACGYGGFVIDESEARNLGAYFTIQKRRLFSKEMANAANPVTWEKKGADIFRPQSPTRAENQVRVYLSILRELRRLGGQVFYYVNEKPIGSPRQVRWVRGEWERDALQETLNRLARHAEYEDSQLLVIADNIEEKTRRERTHEMYRHIYGRASSNPEMKRLVEPPMHVDSALSSNIQLADWIATWLRRLVDYQLLRESQYKWVIQDPWVPHIERLFTYESKLHLYERSVDDLNHSGILRPQRRLHPTPDGQLFADSVDPDIGRKMRGIAAASMRRHRAKAAENGRTS